MRLTARSSTGRSLALFVLGFVVFSVSATLLSAWLGEIPTMSVVSIAAILTLLVGATTQLIPNSVMIAMAAAWPCALLLALMDFGALGASLRPTVTAATLQEVGDSSGRIIEIPDSVIRADVSVSRAAATPYIDSVNRTQQETTARFLVAPLVRRAWNPAEDIELWVGCSDLSDAFDECHNVWQKQSDLRFVHVDPYLYGEFLQTVRLAESQHGLVSVETVTILRALDAPALASVRRLLRLTLAVLTVGLIVGMLWTVRSPA